MLVDIEFPEGSVRDVIGFGGFVYLPLGIGDEVEIPKHLGLSDFLRQLIYNGEDMMLRPRLSVEKLTIH